jgi:hypothetical protein
VNDSRERENVIHVRNSRSSHSVCKPLTSLIPQIDLTLDRQIQLIQSKQESIFKVAQTRRSITSDGDQSSNITPASTPRLQPCSGKNIGLQLAFRKRCSLHRPGCSGSNPSLKSECSKAQNDKSQAFVFEDIPNSIGPVLSSPAQRPTTTGTLQNRRAQLTSRTSSSGMDRESSPRSTISYDRIRANESLDETNLQSQQLSNERRAATKLSGV